MVARVSYDHFYYFFRHCSIICIFEWKIGSLYNRLQPFIEITHHHHPLLHSFIDLDLVFQILHHPDVVVVVHIPHSPYSVRAPHPAPPRIHTPTNPTIHWWEPRWWGPQIAHSTFPGDSSVASRVARVRSVGWLYLEKRVLFFLFVLVFFVICNILGAGFVWHMQELPTGGKTEGSSDCWWKEEEEVRGVSGEVKIGFLLLVAVIVVVVVVPEKCSWWVKSVQNGTCFASAGYGQVIGVVPFFFLCVWCGFKEFRKIVKTLVWWNSTDLLLLEKSKQS